MPRFRRHGKQSEDNRPLVVDDYIYNDPDDASSVASDTPDEAVRKLRGRPKEEPAKDKEPDQESSAPAGSASPDDSSDKKSASAGPRVYSSGVILDENLQPVDAKGRRPRREHRLLRGIALTTVTVVLLLFVAAYVFHRISPSTHGLDQPESLIARIVTPVQELFSGITESIAGYFRSLKLRANIEREYNALRAENERLTYQAMLAEELQHTLSQYRDLSAEILANEKMEPVICTIIGKSDSNYFSTFTINKGSAEGIRNYMAVTFGGALVGYTENVLEHSATVRTIIDSNASIAALIQSSRDHGTVRGTLGVDGTPRCRMYYLPADNLPRSGDMVVTSGVGMSFPKGIPIGEVRESTRGMSDNKQYIVLDPIVDFQHLEYVIVLLYQPSPEAVVGQENAGVSEFVPLESARPSPEIPIVADSLFDTPAPTADVSPSPSPEPEDTSSPTVEPTETPSPVPAVTPDPTPAESPLEYTVVNLRNDPTPTPTPTLEPTATPYLTPDPDLMTWEDDG